MCRTTAFAIMNSAAASLLGAGPAAIAGLLESSATTLHPAGMWPCLLRLWRGCGAPEAPALRDALFMHLARAVGVGGKGLVRFKPGRLRKPYLRILYKWTHACEEVSIQRFVQQFKELVIKPGVAPSVALGASNSRQLSHTTEHLGPLGPGELIPSGLQAQRSKQRNKQRTKSREKDKR